MATNGNHDKKNGSRRNHPLLAFFRDDQVTFLVTHPKETISDNLLKSFKDTVLPQFLADGTLSVSPEVLHQRISFPEIKGENDEQRRKEEQRLQGLQKLDREMKENKDENDKRQKRLEELEREVRKKKDLNTLHRFLLSDEYVPSAYQPQPSLSAFSLLVFNLSKPPDDPLSLLINVLKLRTAWKGEKIEIETLDPEGKKITESLRIEDIVPNWAMSVASNGSGTGGPGGLPRPFQGADADAKYEFDIRQTLSKLYDEVGEGENVDVVILDTAPCPHALAMAPKNWPDNKLIQGLLGPDGKLTLYPATLEDLERMDNASLNRHDYEMSDHGFFIAGIIHSVVRKAKIHLVEVLNQWGIGDLTSLAAGLNKVLTQIYQPGSGRRIVVNCSWMLDLPLVGEHCAPIDATKPESDFQDAILHLVLKDREQASTIWAICNNISLAGGRVISAAGNDWGSSKEMKVKKGILLAGQGERTQEPRGNAPEARYPAGFVSAIGVGALPKDSKVGNAQKHTASNYSNLGDKPEVRGIMTLGGEEEDEVKGQGMSQEETPQIIKGVLGLYLAETYPVEKKSDPPKYKREFNIERRKKENHEENPWASWAGTSFATPIVTGTIAAALSSTKSGATMIQAEVDTVVTQLYDSGIIEDGTRPDAGTEAREDVMEVKQG